MMLVSRHNNHVNGELLRGMRDVVCLIALGHHYLIRSAAPVGSGQLLKPAAPMPSSDANRSF